MGLGPNVTNYYRSGLLGLGPVFMHLRKPIHSNLIFSFVKPLYVYNPFIHQVILESIHFTYF
ncbi:hypothetical protein HanXRQr2_Chr08g0323081 [Helianthus annuus]|uniref:Uncharacterized protein n=1 Tax=Helianthus annuus TaxID=4232 RepID=A0A9K3NB49_HELAN|nr:hypothetical protein HanXRQr2_Chr08g0323081 [Helianthus annuus]KAJ0900363.1 hypothetical protein HanPSC8_Chr08g0312971 [Helianthus annuus]